MNRSSLPGFVLAFVVLAASIAALLLAGHLVTTDEEQGAPLRPAATERPVRLAEPPPPPSRTGVPRP